MPRKSRTMPWTEVLNGVYYVHWYDKGRTKRLSLRTTDEVEAKQRFAAFLSEGHAIFSPGPSGPTVTQVLDAYLQWADENCAAPRRQHKCATALKTYFADTPLKDINIDACEAYAKHRRGMGREDATVRRELVTLRAAAGHALERERIDKLPRIKLPPNAPRGRAPWFTREQLDKILATADDELRDLVTVLYYTAGRLQSVAQLTKSQVDLKNSRIDLRHPDETAAQRRSKKRRGIVPIHQAMRPTIERLMEKPGKRLFPQQYNWWNRFHDVLTKLGFEGTLHTLRHSRATHLLQEGVSIYAVAKLLFDSVKTVDEVYGHNCPDHLGETMARVA